MKNSQLNLNEHGKTRGGNMTREEARAYIQEWLKDEDALNSKDKEALNVAIKALEQEHLYIDSPRGYQAHSISDEEICDYYDPEIKTCRRSEVPKEVGSQESEGEV